MSCRLHLFLYIRLMLQNYWHGFLFLILGDAIFFVLFMRLNSQLSVQHICFFFFPAASLAEFSAFSAVLKGLWKNTYSKCWASLLKIDDWQLASTHRTQMFNAWDATTVYLQCNESNLSCVNWNWFSSSSTVLALWQQSMSACGSMWDVAVM